MKLILEDIKKSFDKKEVLLGTSFTFETGYIYGLLGRNGAGKTTLFNCIND
ncbi:MAG: ATP-binding cassette domain-containing protein, partial [Herbinix sp.]|nr:ATP-binding cassette domain-containing protein [Herbinix sp.]